MRKPPLSNLLALLALFVSFTSISAQSPADQISSWYLEERFLVADQNDDALLDKSELAQYPLEFSYYLEPRHFELADNNADNHLSFQEIGRRAESEFLYRYSLDRKALRELSREYPLLAQADLDYYKSHPQLVKELFLNFAWMVENREVAEKLFKDKSWTSRNPEVLISLQENLAWMAANPGEARQLYRNRSTTSQLPHLLGWRADHQEFIRQNPKLEGWYDLQFMPDAIKVRN